MKSITDAELILELQKYPSNTTVVIDDADTNWNLNIEGVIYSIPDEMIWITGSYNNRYRTPSERIELTKRGIDL